VEKHHKSGILSSHRCQHAARSSSLALAGAAAQPMAAATVARPAIGSRAMHMHQQYLHPTSLLFHFESEHEAYQQKQSEKASAAVHIASKERISFFCSENAAAGASFASRLSRDVGYYCDALRREMGEVDAVYMASRLATVGFSVSVRAGLGGGSAPSPRDPLYPFPARA
jgi:hypothetical protein